MRFKLAILVSAAALTAASAVHAQQAADALPHATDADIQALVATLKADKPGEAVAASPLLRLGTYTALIEYRTGPGTVNVHEVSAEFFHVIEGSGTLITGGTVVEPKRSGTNVTGTDLVGGVSQTVKAGDFFIVPEGTPHWFKAVDGKLVMMSIHLPRDGGAPKP